MDSKKIVKFNLYMSGVLLLAFILMFVSVTIAYFTSTKKATATFTAGNVEITLSEAAVIADESGNLVEDTSKPRFFGGADAILHEYGKVYPSQTIFKDPTITNIGDEPEWIAAKVVLNDGAGDLTEIIGYGEEFDAIDIELLLSGGLLEENVEFGEWNGLDNVCYNDHYAMIQVPNPAHNSYTFYFLILDPVAVGDSVVLFEHVTFDKDWNNHDMLQLADLEIHIQAYGVQTFQMDSCLTAMTEAFPDHFIFN